MNSDRPIASRSGTVAAPDRANLGSSRPVSRNPVLDGLRFLAAALIVLYHYQSEGPWPLSRLSPVFLRGYLATDFFLILSGYVLGRAYGPKLAARRVSDERFLWRRILRVWPAHLAMLAAFVILVAVVAPANPERFRWSDLPAQALLVHAWGLNTGAGWNLPTWSLSALIVCYAAFPSLWRGLSRIRSGLLLFAAGLALIWGADQLSRALFHEDLYDLRFSLGVFRALRLFIFGAGVARIGELRRAGERGAALVLLAAGAAVTLLQTVGRFDLVSMALLGVVIGAAGAIRTTRGARIAGQAAQLSFALYITHIFVAAIWFHVTRLAVQRFHLGEGLQWAAWGLSLPAALATAMAFERFVDRPLQAVCARYLDRAPGRAAILAPERLKLTPFGKTRGSAPPAPG